MTRAGAGVVVALGEGVTSLKIGDRVGVCDDHSCSDFKIVELLPT